MLLSLTRSHQRSLFVFIETATAPPSRVKHFHSLPLLHCRRCLCLAGQLTCLLSSIHLLSSLIFTPSPSKWTLSLSFSLVLLHSSLISLLSLFRLHVTNFIFFKFIFLSCFLSLVSSVAVLWPGCLSVGTIYLSSPVSVCSFPNNFYYYYGSSFGHLSVLILHLLPLTFLCQLHNTLILLLLLFLLPVSSLYCNLLVDTATSTLLQSLVFSHSFSPSFH